VAEIRLKLKVIQTATSATVRASAEAADSIYDACADIWLTPVARHGAGEARRGIGQGSTLGSAEEIMSVAKRWKVGSNSAHRGAGPVRRLLSRRAAAVVTACLLVACATAFVAGPVRDFVSHHGRANIVTTSSPLHIPMVPPDSIGPATPIPGASTGGTIQILLPNDLAHMDPARTRASDQLALGTLITRSLVTYREWSSSDGSVETEIVGDLATNAGVDVNGNCRVWRYTLKAGLKFEDGTAVTSADIAYGVARSFSADLSEGPHYIQNWLTGHESTSADYNQNYQGPYHGGAAIPPGVTTPDTRTIVFTFPKPECEMPWAAALPMTAPVPKASDTGLEYDQHPISTGPYMFQRYVPGTSLVLVRNPNWDPDTDEAHNAYPDRIDVSLNVDPTVISRRLLADAPADQNAISWTSVPPELASQVTGAARQRVIDATTSVVTYIDINTRRVTDLTTRRALNTAIDKAAFLDAAGGNLVGTVQNTIEPSTTGGWDYHTFGAGPTGDPARAQAMLAGDPDAQPALVYCYANTARDRQEAVAVQDSLQKAGFTITIEPVDAASYDTVIGMKDVDCDLYRSEWRADWQSGSTILPPLLDGRSIASSGNQDLSYLNDPGANAEIDRISAETRAGSWGDWRTLDKEIMMNFAPMIPMFVSRNYTLVGSLVGGAFFSYAFGVTSLNTVFVKGGA
jgi:peptide/nickel transport system substrate-binding protein